MTDHVTVTDDGATRVITLRRPDKKNALTQDMYAAISRAIDDAQANSAIHCLVLSGGAGAFTAGNDLDDFMKASSNASGDRPMNAIKFLRSLAHNTKPLVAAVDGVAVGVGTTMIFHCDYVVASTAASFSTPFIHLGLVPEGASSLLVPMAMGHQRAFSLLVMGQKMTAEEAKQAGFVNAVVAPGHAEDEARKIARKISALPAEAVALSRKLLKTPPADVMHRIEEESALFSERLTSKEAAAAFAAFFARKKG